MNKKPRVVFLEDHESGESPWIRGLRHGATGAGWEADVIYLRGREGQMRSDKAVRIDLLMRQPDVVCFLADAPLHLEHLWDAPSLALVDKISLWYEDYFRSPKTLARPEVWTHWQKHHGVRVGIWDEYWRLKWKALTGAEAFPLVLAADPRQFRSNAEPWNPAWADRATFVGTIPSHRSLEEMEGTFPRPMQTLLEEVCGVLATAPWPLRPYEVAQRCQSFLGVKYRLAIEAALRDPAVLAQWHVLLARSGRRIARLRGLAAVGQAGPIAILSPGHDSCAREQELREALPGVDLVFADTKAVPPSSLKNLYRTGKFQVQVIDPQSVSGGLSSRIFECGACGVPLLSDDRPELSALFPPETGLVTVPDEAGFTQAAAALFAESIEARDDRGRRFHRAFQGGHSWQIRWRHLTAGMQIRERASALNARRQPAPPESADVRQPV